ncbi:amidohydrolase family protein [Sphingomonas sp.]|uniref:amidohydrolase family protein n=1 Tax=Sphingomonas sp. TaxID=28214 RepID=UPI003B3ACAE4
MRNLFACLALLCAAPLSAEKLALVGGTLIDGTLAAPIHDSVILVDGQRITAVGTVTTLPVPADARRISTEGMTVMPGLWDMHVHLMIDGHAVYSEWDKYLSLQRDVVMPASAKQLLMAGITGARDLGGPLDAAIAVKKAINEGRIPGPTLFVSGPFLQHKPYPGTEAYRWGVSSPEDGRAKVRRIAAAGVDVVKLIDVDEMAEPEIAAVVDEAHRLKLPVVAHAHRPEEIRLGLKHGVDDFEHTGLGAAPEYPADVMALLQERTGRSGALGPFFWTPTVSILNNYPDWIREHEFVDTVDWHEGLTPEMVADIRKSLTHPERIAYFQQVPARQPTLARKFDQLRKSGAVLLIGTDSGVPMNFHSNSTWQEIALWVNDFGVPPLEAIRAATYWPAVAMKADKDYGTVTEGKYADIIAVKGNAMANIALLQRVDLVMKHGEQVK